MSDQDDNEKDVGDGIIRSENGRFTPGTSPRRRSMGINSRKLSRDLKNMLIEKFGPQDGMLKMYTVAAEILADVKVAAKDRLKAAEFLADRVHGKPVTSVDLSASVERGSSLERDMRKMSPEQLLELVRLARH